MLTVYKASAGSGKTYTLAYEYIKLLLGKHKEGVARPHSRILAITFTNKATAEMKSRILKELHDLTIIPTGGERDAEYAGALMKEYGWTRHELQYTATRALRSLLNDYGAFNVSTIDSFFQTVLRSFAREIDRQGDYRLELDSDMALAQSMSMLFDEINLNPETRESREIIAWLLEEGVARMEEGKDYNPFHRGSPMYSNIVGSIKGIFNEDFAAVEERMNEYFSDPDRLRKFDRWLGGEIERLKEEEVDAARAINALGLVIKSNPQKFIDSIIADGCLIKEKYNGTFRKAGYIAKIREGDTKDVFYKDKGEPDATAHEALLKLIRTLDRNYPLRYMYGEIRARVSSLWAIYHIYRFIERYRIDNNLILISDTNSLLKTIIDGSDTPFIYERVGMEFKNFLIDEFQDTSRLQWENLKPLVGTSLEEEDSLIIGDEKQSIFRWRGADPNLISDRVPNVDFPHLSEVKGAKPGENTNYRSAHDIVRFNNALFHRLANGGEHPVPGYGGVAQSLGAPTAGLSARICINNLQSVEGDTEEVALRSMAEEILDQLSRGYRPGEIAIIYRDNKDGARIAEFLGRNYADRIRFISDDGLLLRNSTAIKLIISLLELFDRSTPPTDRADDNHATRNHTGRLRRIALADRFEFYLAQGLNFDEALDRAEKDDATGDVSAALDLIRAESPANLAALVQAIILHIVPREMSRLEMPYIAAFVDEVEEFMKNYSSSVHSFLAYWNSVKDKIAVSPGESEDAVTLLTVHKAKGLEWPCVHIPLLDWEYEGNLTNEWFDMSSVECGEGVEAPPVMYFKSPNRLGFNSLYRSESSPFKAQYDRGIEGIRNDNLNVAYVAFTRPSRELHVNIMPPGKNFTRIGDTILQALQDAVRDDERDGIYMNLSEYMRADGSFEFGSATTPVRKSEKSVGLPMLPAPDFNVSFESLGDRLTRVSDLVSVVGSASDVTDDAPREIVDSEFENAGMEEAARFGIAMHSVLSQMTTFDDLGEAVERECRYNSDCDPEEVTRMLTEAFENADADVARWFDPTNPRVATEQPIYSRLSGATWRADRIVWLPDGSVEVVDYKFTSGVRRDHFEQVRDYATALSAMGYKVRGYLWYPLLRRVIPVG